MNTADLPPTSDALPNEPSRLSTISGESPTSPLLYHDNINAEGIEGHQTLGSLREFWTVSWMLFLEVTGLIIIGATTLHEPHASLYPSHLLKFIPFGASIFACLIALFMPRGNRFANAQLMIISLLTATVGSAAVYYASTDYWILLEGGGSSEEECEERAITQWTTQSIRTLTLAVVIWPIPFRLATAWASFRLLPPAPKIAARYYIHEPNLHFWEGVIYYSNRFITCCCIPQACAAIAKDQTKANLVHHVVQLIYEVALLITALVEGKHLETFAIFLGLAGACSGIFNMHRLDTIMNTLAIVLTIAVTIADLMTTDCNELIQTSARLWLELTLMNMVANLIRIKSVIHSYVVSKEKLWEWLKEQKEWVRYSSSAPLFKTLSHTDNHFYRDQLESSKMIIVALIKSFKIYWFLWMAVIGSALFVAFGVTMIFKFPLAELNQEFTEGIRERPMTTCTIMGSTEIEGNGFKFTYFSVIYPNYSDGELLASPLGALTYAAAIEEHMSDVQIEEEKEKFPVGSNHTCLLPSMPALYRNIFGQIIFRGRDATIILIESLEDLDRATVTYNTWLIVPIVFMVLGCIGCWGGCCILRKHNLKAQKNKKKTATKKEKGPLIVVKK